MDSRDKRGVLLTLKWAPPSTPVWVTCAFHVSSLQKPDHNTRPSEPWRSGQSIRGWSQAWAGGPAPQHVPALPGAPYFPHEEVFGFSCEQVLACSWFPH